MTKKTWATIAIVVLILVAAALIWNPKKQDSDTITIGAVLPLSGKAAQYGKWIQEGLELGKDQINDQGGINGKKLAIIYEDDAANPKDAASAMQKLTKINKVPVVYGSWASSCVLAQAPIAEQSRTVLIAEAISPKIRDAGDYVFRMQPDARYYIRQLVPFVFDQMGARSICILYVNNDFGLDQAEVFDIEFVKLGGRVLHSEGYDPQTSDFRTQLLKVKGNQPDAVFVPGYAELGLILKQARELGMSQRFIGSVPSENPDIIETAGEAAEGLIYPHHFNPNSMDGVVKDYQNAYKERYGRLSEGFAALAYDGIRIIADVLREVGESPEDIKNELYTVRDFRGVTGRTAFDDHGDTVKDIVIKIIKEGRFQSYDGDD